MKKGIYNHITNKAIIMLFIITNLAFVYVTYLFLRTLYRLSPLHPLYKFPWASRWACVSEWYEFYWNGIQDGQFIFKIEQWHKKHGPIVRIGPNELHIADPSFYATAFAMGYKYPLRYEHYKFANVGEDCQVGLRDIAEHKRRRQVFNPLFSKASINKLDYRIRKYIDNAVAWIDKQSTTGEGIKIGKLFRALTVDIISEYAYADSMDTVARGDLDTPFISGMKTAMPMMWFFGFFWPIQEFMNAVPFKVLQKVLPRDMLGMLEMQNKCEDDVKAFLKDPEMVQAKYTHKTVFEALIMDGPKAVKDYKIPHTRALKREAFAFLGAGMETTANAITVGLLEAVRNPEVQNTLYEELTKAFPNGEDMSSAACERLPYLSCFIKEVLRVAPGVPGRLPRIVPDCGASVAGEYIIPGTIVSMSAYIMHNDPEVFVEPHKFSPVRWAYNDRALDKQWVPFSRGSRGCLGQNLAMAELYTTFAAIFRNFEFELHGENTMGDEWVDHFMQNKRGDLVVTAKRR